MKKLLCLLLIIACVHQAQAWHYWSGAGEDDLWTNPLNWLEGTIPAGDDVRINSEEGGAVLAAYEETCTNLIIGYNDPGAKNGELTIEAGGVLSTVNNGYVRFGHDAGCVGTLNIKGGTFNQPANACYIGYNGTGIVNLYDGMINVYNWRYPYSAIGNGVINMYDGEMRITYGIRIGFSGSGKFNHYGGELYSNAFRVTATGKYFLAGGTLYCTDGNQTSLLQGYIDSGWIAACGGYGFEPIVYDAATGTTRLKAVASYSQAWGASPANNEEAVQVPSAVTWNAPLSDPNFLPLYDKENISYDVYFGLSDQMAFQGNQTATTFTPAAAMQRGQSYQWRVDLVSGGSVVATGDLWSFTVSEIKTVLIAPANNATGIPVETTLEWTTIQPATSYTVYLSTDQQKVIDGDPQVIIATQTATTAAVSLDYTRTYYWRVDEVVSGETYIGDLWRFSTIIPECSETLAGDVTGDCEVNIKDLVQMVSDWGQCNWVPAESWCD